MILVVLSGKGGTGKTTVAACLALLAARPVIADADVDAPNLHLLLRPVTLARREFKGAKVAVREEVTCTRCGKCTELCRFQAISETGVDAARCTGCGVCVRFCPAGALHLEEKTTGSILLSETPYGPFSHALLEIGEEASGKLVTEVCRQAEALEGKLLIVDGAPGVGCPVISSLTGATFALLVTEPSVAALHDLARLLTLVRHFRVPAAAVLNKSGLYPEAEEEIARFCRKEGLRLLGRVPFDPEVVRVVRAGAPPEELLSTRAGGGAKRNLGEIEGGVRLRMKIAVAAEGNFVSPHFGHCEKFWIFETAGKEILRRRLLPNPGHQPGLLPALLAEEGVEVVIAQGMGVRAQEAFAARGIQVVTGAEGEVEEVTRAFLEGRLSPGPNTCDH